MMTDLESQEIGCAIEDLQERVKALESGATPAAPDLWFTRRELDALSIAISTLKDIVKIAGGVMPNEEFLSEAATKIERELYRLESSEDDDPPLPSRRLNNGERAALKHSGLIP